MKNIEEKKWCVYCHTNKINGKRYIGITCQLPETRWGSNGCRYTSSTRFWNSIKKYGWNTFTHEILITNLTKSEASFEEIKLIQKYKTTNTDFGYNISQGGDTGNGVPRVCKKVYQYSLDGNFVKMYDSLYSASQETNINIHCIGGCCRGDYLTAGNYQWRYLNKDLIIPPVLSSECRRSESKKRPILQYSLDGDFLKEWDSVVCAAIELEINRTSIINCCKGIYFTAGNYQWKKKTNDTIIPKVNKVLDRNNSIKLSNGKGILQIDENTKQIVHEYCTIGEATKSLHISRNKITDCLKKRLVSYKGSIWKYTDECVVSL